MSSLWYRRWTPDCGEWTRLLSRVLVVLTILLLMVMPITEHLCNWDRFLRGGPDVEFSVLAWLLFAAMVVLSMQGAMLRPVAMQPTSMEAVAGADKLRSPGRPATYRIQIGGDFGSPCNEIGLIDLFAPVPLRI